MITVDSPEQVIKGLSAVGGAVQNASCVMLEDEIPIGEFPCVDDALIQALLVKATDTPPLRARRARLVVNGA